MNNHKEKLQQSPLKPFGFGHHNNPVTKMVKPLRTDLIQDVIKKIQDGTLESNQMPRFYGDSKGKFKI